MTRDAVPGTPPTPDVDPSDLAELTRRLAASEARWRAVIDSAIDGVVVIDTHGRIETFNHGAERMFGYLEQEVVGQNVSVLMPSPYREEHDSYMARYLATGEARIIGIGREVQGRHKDGTTFPLHLSVGQMEVDGQRRFTGILHDLTNRVRMEERLREQATLVQLGEMAAVLAHEIKNPLAGIRGAVQVVGARLPADNPSGPVLEEIIARIDALDAMMKDLLLFARQPKPRPQPIAIVPIVNGTVELLHQDPAFRDVAITVTGSAPVLQADPDMLRIVVHNLLLNGAQAMEGRGAMRVEVSADGEGCTIAIADEGPGISADVRARLFTPFMTTKARGTGLGLATVKRMVEAHGGTIGVTCPAEGGTRVDVRLPFAAAVPVDAKNSGRVGEIPAPH